MSKFKFHSERKWTTQFELVFGEMQLKLFKNDRCRSNITGRVNYINEKRNKLLENNRWRLFPQQNENKIYENENYDETCFDFLTQYKLNDTYINNS